MDPANSNENDVRNTDPWVEQVWLNTKWSDDNKMGLKTWSNTFSLRNANPNIRL
jgi:hypothetical protein